MGFVPQKLFFLAPVAISFRECYCNAFDELIEKSIENKKGHDSNVKVYSVSFAPSIAMKVNGE